MERVVKIADRHTKEAVIIGNRMEHLQLSHTWVWLCCQVQAVGKYVAGSAHHQRQPPQCG